MIYSGNAITVQMVSDGIAEFRFNLQGETFNHFNEKTLLDLQKAIAAVKSASHIQGLMVTSGKNSFILGSDMAYCVQQFSEQWIEKIHTMLADFEQLNIPKVAAIDGSAIGSGFEFALTCDYRIATKNTSIALPELTFGLTPFFGGTVRLPRIIGIKNSMSWWTSQKRISAQEAFEANALDTVVEVSELKLAATHTLKLAIANQLDWRKRRTHTSHLSEAASIFLFDQLRAQIFKQFSPAHYPVYKYLLDHLKNTIYQNREQALKQEAALLNNLLNLDQTHALLQLYSSHQHVKNITKKYKRKEHPIHKLAVFGVNPQSYDFAKHALTCKIQTYVQDLDTRDCLQVLKELNCSIEHYPFLSPMLEQHQLNQVDVIVENSKVDLKTRRQRLEQLEQYCHRNTILLINLDTYPLHKLTADLKHQESIIGLHYIDDTQQIVELVTTSHTSEVTIATTVGLLQRFGKRVVVIKDAQSFFFQRITNACVTSYTTLLQNGFNTEDIEQALHQQGWDISAQDWAVQFNLSSSITPIRPKSQLTNDDIVDFMMTAFCNEVIRCLEEHIIDSYEEADVLVTEFLGFSDFKGGVCYYIQHIGVAEYIALCEKYASFGSSYQTPRPLSYMLENNYSFFQKEVV